MKLGRNLLNMAEGYTFRSSQSFTNCSLENVDINYIKVLNSQSHLVYTAKKACVVSTQIFE